MGSDFCAALIRVAIRWLRFGLIFERTLQIVGVVAGTVLLLLLSWLAYINSMEEPLKPEVRRWLDKTPRELSPRAPLGFYIAYGMSRGDPSPENAAALWAQAERLADPGDDSMQWPPAAQLPAPFRCGQHIDCLRQLADRPDRRQLLNEQATLLENYELLQTAGSIRRPALPSDIEEHSPVVMFTQLQRVWQLQQIADWQAGKTAEVLQAIAVDNRLWLNAMREASQEVDAVLASLCLLQNYQLLGWLEWENPRAVRQHPSLWRKLLTPSPLQGRDLEVLLWSDAIWFKRVLDDYRDTVARRGAGKARLNLELLAQNNRTLNRMYMLQQHRLRQLQLPPAQLAALDFERPQECDDVLPYVQSPYGTYLLCLLTGKSYRSAVMALHRAEALRRLLLVKSQLDGQTVPDGPVAVAASLRNPWDNSLPQGYGGKLEFNWPCPKCKERIVRLP